MHMTGDATTLSSLLGWWQLISCDIEFQASGRLQPIYGTPASGYIYFDANGQMMTVIEALGPDPRIPIVEAEQSRRGMAYAGSFQLMGNQWVTQVDAACNVGWTGTVQRRWFRVEGDHLLVHSDWGGSPQHSADSIRARLVWKRCPQSMNGISSR